MENQIQQFTNQLFGTVRVLNINNQPWFIGSEIALILGYSNPWDALAKHVFEEDKNTLAICEGIPGNPNKVIINESGLYSLIFGSRLPSAKEFKHWVTSEILPMMRRIGFDRSQQLLENEILRLREENNYLKQQNSNMSSLSIGKNLSDNERKIIEYYIITNPNFSIEDKIEAFNFDPTILNPEIDLDCVIENFKSSYNIF